MLRTPFRALVLAGLGVAVSATALAQRTHPKATSEMIPGYWDTTTNTFVTQIPIKPAAEVDAAATTKYTGTVKFNFTIALLESVPSGFDVLCEGDISTADNVSGLDQEVSNESVAKVTGSTATCAVSVPYSFTLSSGSNSISPSYYITLMPSSSSTVAADYLYKDFTSSLASINFPSNGTLTDLKVEATF
jgi:hypothetical protein